MPQWGKPRTPREGDWTPEQVFTLRRMAGRAPVKEIAAAVGRPEQATHAKAQSLSISLAYVQQRSAWSSGEIAALRRLAETHTLREAAAVLGRTVSSVTGKANRERISFGKTQQGDA